MNPDAGQMSRHLLLVTCVLLLLLLPGDVLAPACAQWLGWRQLFDDNACYFS